MRADYRKLNPDSLRALSSIKKFTGSIPLELQAIVEIRVSQINGCAYCVDAHSKEARHAGVPQQKLDCLTVWEESDLFTEQECAALGWAEALTHAANSKVEDDDYDILLEYFTEQEIVDLTMIIATMNAWNRIGVGFGLKPIYHEE